MEAAAASKDSAKKETTGGQQTEVVVRTNNLSKTYRDFWGRAKVKALNIPLNRILDAVRNSNLDRPAGRIEKGRYEVTLRAPAEFQNLDQIRNTVVAMRQGSPVTIGQIADVLDTYEKPDEIERINGVRGIRVAIRKEATANTVEVSQGILKEIDRIKLLCEEM